MSIKSLTTLAAATAAILGGLAIEASAGPSCGTGGGARYSSAPRAVSAAPKPVAAKATPAARQNVAQANPPAAKPASSKIVASASGDAGSGTGEAAPQKAPKIASAPVRQAAPVQAPIEEAPAQATAGGIGDVETSVSAIAARLAAMSGRRSAAPVE